MTERHKKHIKRSWHGIIGAVAFTFMGILLPTFIEHVAPLSYFVKVEEIAVSNLKCDSWEQDIAISRSLRKTLAGLPHQELFLYKVTGGSQSVLVASPPASPVAYSKQEGDLVLYTQEWTNKVARETLESLDKQAVYYLVWHIDFEVAENRTLRGEYRTNDFTIVCNE